MRFIFKTRAAKQREAELDVIHNHRPLNLGHANPGTLKFLAESAAEVATTVEYTDWLVKHFAQGGKIMSIWDAEMSNQVHIARQWASQPELNGSSAVRIIVPEHTLSGHVHGSNVLLLNDGNIIEGNPNAALPYHPSVVLYKDTIVELKRRGYSFGYLARRYVGTPHNYARSMHALEQGFFKQPKIRAASANM